METSRDLGVDFHNDRFTVDYFEGSRHKKQTFELKDRELFFKDVQSTDSLTIEAMTGVMTFIRELDNRVGTVNIVNPAKFNNNNSNRNKTDGIDAKMLAEAGRSRRYQENGGIKQISIKYKNI